MPWASRVFAAAQLTAEEDDVASAKQHAKALAEGARRLLTVALEGPFLGRKHLEAV